MSGARQESNDRGPEALPPPGLSTRAVHGAEPAGGAGGGHWLGTAVGIPLVQASTFSFSSPEEMLDVFDGRLPGYVYSRYDNPTVRAVEGKLAALEGGEFALLFAAGLAALHAVLWTSLREGDRLLAGRDLYGGTADLIGRLLPRIGAECAWCDMGNEDALREGLGRRPALVLFETPTNPLLRVIDGRRICALAREAGSRVAVDNTFATPILQNPLLWGADLVVHSATKYLGGHSDVTLGVVVGRGQDRDPIEKVRRSMGAVPDPFAAWLLNRGLATLAVRVRAQSATAEALAKELRGRPGIERVHHPALGEAGDVALARSQMRALGGMLSLDLQGGREGAIAFLRGLRRVLLATSLGGCETLASHPATSSHRMISSERREEIGIREGLVRLSVGLEDYEDLRADLLLALRAVHGAR